MDPREVKKVINLTKPWNFGGDADRCTRNGTGRERWDNKVPHKYHGQYREGCLHDHGKYNWGRICYEGKIYANNLNGYGIMSYPEGSVFEGLYKQNQRFGPGVLTYSDSSQDVGLWIGHQLIRLADNLTEKYVPNIAESFEAKAYVNKYKKLIPISKGKSAPHSLLQEIFPGHDVQDVQKLCNKFVKNPQCFFFDLVSFDEAYFSDEKVPVIKSFGSSEPILEEEVVSDLLSWNNEKDQMELRKHIFDHRNFEHGLSYDVHDVLGNRSKFGPNGCLEKKCQKLFQSVLNGENKTICTTITMNDLNPDVCDCLGNTCIHCAVAHDNLIALKRLVDLGADLDRMNDECLTPLIICLLRFLEVKENVINWQVAFLPPLIPSENLENYILDISCKVVLLPLKKKKEKRKKEKKEKPQKEKKGKKSKTEGNEVAPPEEVEEHDPRLYTIYQTLITLLGYGADPNLGEVPLPPLFLSLFTLDEAVLLTLIKYGANCNLRTSHEDGFLSPLHVIAAMKPNPLLPKFVRILVNYGAELNLRSNVIHWLEQKHKIMMEENCIDEGKTALQLLSMRYDFFDDEEDLLGALYDVMVQVGCDPNLFYLGHNCLSLAVLRGNLRLMNRILQDSEVDPNQALGCGLGVPLTIHLLKRYKNLLPLYACQEAIDALIFNGANPLNSVSEESNLNAIEFCEEENKPDPQNLDYKIKINKKDPHYKLIQYFFKAAQAILERRNMAKVVENIFIYKTMFNFYHPIFEKQLQTMEFEDILKILQIFINNDHIPVIPEALVDLLDYISRIYASDKCRRSSSKSPGPRSPGSKSPGPKSPEPKSPKSKESTRSSKVPPKEKFAEMVENLIQNKILSQPKKFGVRDPEVDLDDEKYKVCYNCLKKLDKNLVLCPECEMIYFCSIDCNKSSLKKTTKHKCKNLFYSEELARGDRKKSAIEELEEKRIKLLENPFDPVLKYISNANYSDDNRLKVKFALPKLPKIKISFGSTNGSPTTTTPSSPENSSIYRSKLFQSYTERQLKSLSSKFISGSGTFTKKSNSSRPSSKKERHGSKEESLMEASRPKVRRGSKQESALAASKSKVPRGSKEASLLEANRPKVRRGTKDKYPLETRGRKSPMKSADSTETRQIMAPKEMEDSIQKTLLELDFPRIRDKIVKKPALGKFNIARRGFRKEKNLCENLEFCSLAQQKLPEHKYSFITKGKRGEIERDRQAMIEDAKLRLQAKENLGNLLTPTLRSPRRLVTGREKYDQASNKLIKEPGKDYSDEFKQLQAERELSEELRKYETVADSKTTKDQKLPKKLLISIGDTYEEKYQKRVSTGQSTADTCDRKDRKNPKKVCIGSSKVVDQVEDHRKVLPKLTIGKTTYSRVILGRDKYGKDAFLSGIHGRISQMERDKRERERLQKELHEKLPKIKGDTGKKRNTVEIILRPEKDQRRMSKSRENEADLDIEKMKLPRIRDAHRGSVDGRRTSDSSPRGSYEKRPESAKIDPSFSKKLKLGDKVPMSPNLIGRLGSILRDSKHALHSATLINGQLYYKFKKYKAYSNVKGNNFSFL